MPASQETKLIREATDIFLRLRDDPDSQELQRKRDRFLERGKAERDAYAKMLRAWKLTDTGEESGPSSRLLPIAAAAMFLGGGYLAYDPVRIAFLADMSSGYQTEDAQLASGDVVTLDATSAIEDNTDRQDRHVTLIQGAAFFDVESSQRPFTVTAGALRVEVTGTSFEVGHLENGGIVSVAEGSVTVFADSRSWQLQAGQQLFWSQDDGAELTDVDVSDAASWRRDILVADGVSFGQITDVLERRMPGNILVIDSDLAERAIVGTFDLSDPRASLDLLAALTGARITTLPYIVTVVRPG